MNLLVFLGIMPVNQTLRTYLRCVYYLNMREYISNTVYENRLEKNVTQEDLARTLGVSRQTVIAIEKGNYTPSVMLAIKIADFFKVQVNKIFTIQYEK